MLINVVDAKYISGYKIWVQFDTGEEGEVDLADILWGEVFEPLKDKKKFRRFKVDPEAGTVVWENGADIAPESLYRRATALHQDRHANDLRASRSGGW
jgi:hypothetical protein